MQERISIRIQPLQKLMFADVQRVLCGYSSSRKYAITRTETATGLTFELRLVSLDTPYVKAPEQVTPDMLARYEALLPKGYSFGAYDDARLVGLILAEPVRWNKSINVCEFHVLAAYQQKGIGKRLMQCIVDKANAAGERIIVCETQNTNVPAINVYHRLGFHIEAVDISYYSNSDFPEGEMAVFMKQRL